MLLSIDALLLVRYSEVSLKTTEFYIVIDIETDGLDENEHTIIEIGAL